MILIAFASCKKEDPIYDVNQIQSTSYNANKNKLKSIAQEPNPNTVCFHLYLQMTR